MDALAERAGLGKGTVFRRFGTRAGIFRALLEDAATRFQQDVLSGPPPLGPGAPPDRRMIAYGRERIAFLFDNQDVARATLDRAPALSGEADMTRMHLRMLLAQAGLGLPDLDALALQLSAALEGPLVLYLAAPGPAGPAGPAAALESGLADSWQDLVERVFAGQSPEG